LVGYLTDQVHGFTCKKVNGWENALYGPLKWLANQRTISRVTMTCATIARETITRAAVTRYGPDGHPYNRASVEWVDSWLACQ